MLAWQLHRVKNADFPGLRAVQALDGAIPLFLVAFAAAYLSLSHADATHFSEPLAHTPALYLTVTIFSIVGFGDITPEGDLAKIIVSIQMILRRTRCSASGRRHRPRIRTCPRPRDGPPT